MTLSSSQVKSYLSASTTGNIKYRLRYFLIRLLVVCLSLAGALDAIIILDITEFRVGNHCCCEFGGHATALQLQPSLPHLVGLATPDCTRGPSGIVGVAGPISSRSLPHRCLVAQPHWAPWGPIVGATIARTEGCGITSCKFAVFTDCIRYTYLYMCVQMHFQPLVGHLHTKYMYGTNASVCDNVRTYILRWSSHCK